MGKESLAQIIHGLSNRGSYDFIVLDCNPRQKFDYAYSHNLNTPANRKQLLENFQRMLGYAQNGTLFFRSFTHLPLMAQSVWVDALNKGKCILPENGNVEDYKGRIIFGTNKYLSELVSEDKLNPQLYKKLMDYVIRMKPIAEYKDDLVPMAKAIKSHFCLKVRGLDLQIMPDAERAISNYEWSGNLEEMMMIMEIAVAEADNLKIRDRNLTFTRKDIPKREDQASIEEVLRKFNGNKTKAHKELNMSRSHLYKLMKKYGIPQDFK